MVIGPLCGPVIVPDICNDTVTTIYPNGIIFAYTAMIHPQFSDFVNDSVLLYICILYACYFIEAGMLLGTCSSRGGLTRRCSRYLDTGYNPF